MFATNTIFNSDALDGLTKLPDNSIDMVITSPPYWGLRDYGPETISIWGGPSDCDHRWAAGSLMKKSGGKESAQINHHRKGIGHFESQGQSCAKCGAWKGQLGSEPDFALYLCHLFQIFCEIQRVLKPTGTLWVNIGDTYTSSGGWSSRIGDEGKASIFSSRFTSIRGRGATTSVKGKCLIGIPERFMLGMIQQDWILRNKVIWHKPNCMPIPIKDRFTNSWEYLFMFSKAKKYFFDLDAVRQPHKLRSLIRTRSNWHGHREKLSSWHGMDISKMCHPLGRNPVDVWTIPAKGFKGAHFATFPEQLLERPIKAGCPKFVCRKCGTPKFSQQRRVSLSSSRENAVGKREGEDSDKNGRTSLPRAKEGHSETEEKVLLSCQCDAGHAPGIVLDPFMGSGTTALVAKKLGRRFVGFEPNSEYVRMAEDRLKEKAS